MDLVDELKMFKINRRSIRKRIKVTTEQNLTKEFVMLHELPQEESARLMLKWIANHSRLGDSYEIRIQIDNPAQVETVRCMSPKSGKHRN